MDQSPTKINLCHQDLLQLSAFELKLDIMFAGDYADKCLAIVTDEYFYTFIQYVNNFPPTSCLVYRVYNRLSWISWLFCTE